MMKENIITVFGKQAAESYAKFDYYALGNNDSGVIRDSILFFAADIALGRIAKSIASLEKRQERIADLLKVYKGIIVPDELRIEEMRKLEAETAAINDSLYNLKDKKAAAEELIASVPDEVTELSTKWTSIDKIHVAAAAAYIYKVVVGNEDFDRVAALLATFGNMKIDNPERKAAYLRGKTALIDLLKRYSTKEDGTIIGKYFYNVNQSAIHDMAAALVNAKYKLVEDNSVISVGYVMGTSRTAALRTIFGYMLNARRK